MEVLFEHPVATLMGLVGAFAAIILAETWFRSG
jgi:hypothetical protein